MKRNKKKGTGIYREIVPKAGVLQCVFEPGKRVYARIFQYFYNSAGEIIAMNEIPGRIRLTEVKK